MDFYLRNQFVVDVSKPAGEMLDRLIIWKSCKDWLKFEGFEKGAGIDRILV